MGFIVLLCIIEYGNDGYRIRKTNYSLDLNAKDEKWKK
jgi:hypothetical protein